jgi:beta-1,4-mannosyl-glycoprotein beta-1,4-N-acetylglucosaminyltransferase
MERQQRNAMAQPLDRFAPDDIVIFSDVDEIPNRNAIEEAATAVRNGERVVAFEQDFFYFNFDQLNANKWPGTLISTVGQVRAFTPDLFRTNRYTYPRIAGGGWHLSYWGSPYQIQYKIDNFSHQEVNLPQFNNIDNIANSITERKDLYNRAEEQWLQSNRESLDPEMLAIFSRLEYKI